MSLDDQLPGLGMAAATRTAADLAAFLPRLRTLLEHHAVLAVLDAADGLFTADGTWRDPAWGHLVRALLSHRGASRLVLTAEHVPRDLHGADLAGLVAVEDLPELSARERALRDRRRAALGLPAPRP